MSDRNPLENIRFAGPELEDDEVIIDAICIVRVQRMSVGKSRVVTYKSEGLDDIVETGLLQIHAARDMTAWTGAGLLYTDDDD